MSSKDKEQSRQNKRDALKEAIFQQRDELDQQLPPAQLWDRISEQLDEEAGISRPEPIVRKLPVWQSTWMRVAAVLVVFAVAALLFREFQGNTGQTEQPLAETPVQEELEVNPLLLELNDVETYYRRLVDEQSGQIRSASGLEEADAETALEFLDELEDEYKKLEQELEGPVDPGKVLDAMIRNYKQRIDLLQQLSKMLNRQGNSQEHENQQSHAIL